MIHTATPPAAGRRDGYMVVFLFVCLVALLGILAISLDGGSLLSERRHAQAAADAAALAAASDLYKYYWEHSGADPNGSARSSALRTAARNGFDNNDATTTVTVNLPPQSGPYAGRRGYVEVIVEGNEARGFSSVFGSDLLTVRARAVALGAPVAADVGILVLDPSARAALNSQGGGLTDVGGTPVIVNSAHPDAAAVAGGGGALKSDEFIFVGGHTTSGGGQFIGPITRAKVPVFDPLADLPVPDKNSMTEQSNKKVQHTSGNIYLEPGVYKGGISVSGSASLYLAPGVYYMDGGGFSFSGQGSLFGEGVMIYNAPKQGQSSGISVSGQGSLVLSGMTEGVYKGITFFQDRTSNTTGEVQGAGGNTSITGTFYFAGALLKISGNGGVSNMGSQYISRMLNLGGNGGIQINWNPEHVAQRRTIALVE
ncbi:MAG: pilus assembly protein TadG-related protein [Gemmataceae bacterium]